MKERCQNKPRNLANISKLFEIVDHYQAFFPKQKTAFAIKTENHWKTVSPVEYKETTDKMAYAFLWLGIQPGDRIGIISNNRPEWNMLDMAIMKIGAITVPIYPTISEHEYQVILNHSGVTLVVIEGHEVMAKISNILPQVPSLKYVYTFADHQRFPHLSQLITLGQQHPNIEELRKRAEQIDANDCCTIMYTSGTTGMPKGVMLSHKNIVSQLMNLRATPSHWCDRALSFLPLCHAYERMLVFLYQYLGITVYYVQNLGAIAENIKEVRPTIMSTVPRMLEKMFDKIWISRKKMRHLSKWIFTWAVHLAQEYRLQEEDRTWWYNFKHRIADHLVYRKIRASIGGDFDIVVSGAASIQPRLAAFFSAIGMPVFEGYGATETSPVIAVSSRSRYGREVGTVGFPLPGVEVRISNEGEILCRGHNVMLGYYHAPELTAAAIDAEGWFHTGDSGRFTPHGQLVVSGRIKNLFKTSFGKYVNPQTIEEKFCESPFIDNIVVVGENQKFAAAIIVPNLNLLKSWCQQQGINIANTEEMVQDRSVIKRMTEEVTKYNQHFGNTEQVKRFELIPDEWTQQNGMLTPTLKVKRHIVLQRYAEVLERLFK